MSLRKKVVLPLVFSGTLLIAYLYGYWMPHSLARTEAAYRLSLERHLDSVAEGLIPLLLAHQLDALYENLDALGTTNSDWTDIRLLDPDGRSLYPLLDAAASRPRPGQDIRMLEHRIQHLDAYLGKLIVGVDFGPRLSEMKKREKELLAALLVILSGYIVAVAIMVEWVVRRPVTLLAHASRRLARGEFDVSLPKAGSDEVGVLVDSFRGMREAIRDYQSELLQRNEAISKLSHAVQQSPVSIVITDTDGRIVFVNPKFTQLTGYAPEEVMGQNPRLLKSGLTPPSEYERLWKCITSGAVWRGELCNRKKNGELYWESASISPIQDEKGAIAYYLAVKEDITERRQTDEVLRASERRLAEAQRIAHVGSWDLDLLHNRLSWSDEIYRIFGLEPQSFGATYEAFLEAVHPDDREAVNNAYTASVRDALTYDIIHRIVRRSDGEIRYVHEKCEHVRNAGGEIIHSSGTVQDITELKRAEEKLKAASSYNRSLIEASLDPLVTIDANGTITDVNAATEEVTGSTRGELIGTNFLDYFTEPEKAQAGYQQVFREGFVRDYPLEIRHRDAHVTPVLYNASLFRDAAGSVAGVFAAARDVTELRKAEHEIRMLNESLEQRVAERTADLEKAGGELRESQRALMNIVEDLNQKTVELEQANSKLKELDRLKSMFIASMSHELRTPLNSIIGFSSIILDEWIGPLSEEQKKNLATVLRSGKHLLALINDVIDVSKIEAGKIEAIGEDFDLHDLIAEALALLKTDIQTKGLDVRVDSPHLAMHTDRRRLFQCLVNILGNAVKFTDAGTITLQTAPVRSNDDAAEPDLAEITVTDTGIGIKEEDLPKLFVAFTRLPSPLTLKVKGTGLGLYLVRKIATEILGGKVTAGSVYGEGSSFQLTVPITLAAGETHEKSFGH